MPCVWLLQLTYTIAEFNPNAITHLGDFSSLSSIRFQPVDLNRFNRYLEIEYSTKNSNGYPWYMYISSLSSRRCAYKGFFDVRSVLNASWEGESTHRICEV